MSALRKAEWKAERLRAYRDTSVHRTDVHSTDVHDPHVPGADAHESSDGRAVAGASLDPHLVLFCDTGADAVVTLPGGVTAVSIGGVYARVAASAWGATWLERTFRVDSTLDPP